MPNNTFNSSPKTGLEDQAVENESPPNYVTFRQRLQGNNAEVVPFQETVLTILAEMQQAQEAQLINIAVDIKEIKQQNKKIQETQDSLEQSVKFMSDMFEDIKQKVQEHSEEIKKLKDSEKIHQEQILNISDIEEKLEEANRKLREKSVEIRNVPFHKDEDKQKILANIYNALGVDYNSRSTGDIYRVSTKEKTIKPLIVEFFSIQDKRDLLGGLKNLNKTKKPLTASDLGFLGNNSPIYAADYLTPHAAKLFYQARALKRQHGFKYCWTSLGKVYLKKEDGSPALLIKNESSIAGAIPKEQKQ